MYPVAIHCTDQITRAGLVSLLQSEPDLEVLAEPDTRRAKVLVLHAGAGSDETITHLHRLHRDGRHQYCVVVADRFRDTDLMPALECGLISVLSRHDAVTSLGEVVAAACRGSAGDLRGMLTQLKRLRENVLPPDAPLASGLTQRECDVLQLMSEGFTTDEIAVKLCYSERTVKNVLYGMMNRLHLRSRAHAVAYALRVGAI